MAETIGKTTLGTPILLHRWGPSHLPKLLLIGGVHGDEPEGVLFVEEFLKRRGEIEKDLKMHLLIIPQLNPDGVSKNERTNANGVDLNRNFPASDWNTEARAPRYYPGPKPCSEIEIQTLVALIKSEKPTAIFHCHSYLPQLVYAGPNAQKWATQLGEGYPHPVQEDIGYPTPGSLGQYCKLDIQTPCVCIEFPERINGNTAWSLLGSQLKNLVTRGLKS